MRLFTPVPLAAPAAHFTRTALAGCFLTLLALLLPLLALAQAPTITSFSPASGAVGSSITITGTNLTGTTQIAFTGTSSNTVSSGYAVATGGTSISGIVVPAGARTGALRVTTTAGGISAASSSFAVLPTISSLSVSSGRVGTSVTITGTGLLGATSVSFNGTPQTTITGNTTSTSLTATVPTGTLSGPGPVTVTTPGGTSNGLAFAVVPPARTLATGYNFTLSIHPDGTLWAWGNNQYGQLGDGTTISRSTPAQVGTATNWVSVAAGQYHALALRADGTLWAWGNNTNGQLGLGLSAQVPTQVGTLTTWRNVAAGQSYSLAIKTDGTLWVWGSGSNNTPGQAGSATTWLTVAAGCESNHTLALQNNGSLWSWGDNASGQLGSGTTTSRSSPVQVVTAPLVWRDVAAGQAHSLGLTTDGALYAWGSNQYGRLGDGSSTNSSSPVRVGLLNTWAGLAAGSRHSLALQTDGTLWAWGYNSDGQLGDGSTTNRPSPGQVGTSTAWTGLAAGDYSAGEQSCRAVWTWGYNNSGQLGDGTTTSRSSPVQVPLLRLVPATAPVGATVMATGTGLAGLTALSVNGVDALASVTNNSATGFSFVVPAGTSTSGTVAATPGAGCAVVSLPFVVRPGISSFSPASGAAGTSVVVTGTGFSGVSSVRFGTINAPTYTVNSATQITVTVPAGVVLSPIWVTTSAGGPSSSSTLFAGRGCAGSAVVAPAGPLVLPANGSATLTASASLPAFVSGSGNGFNNTVSATVALPNGQTLVGGYFTSYTYGGVTTTVNRLARLNADGSLDLTFIAGASSGISGVSASVNALAVQPDGKILVGGSFNTYTYNGVARTAISIVRLTSAGAFDTSFGGTTNNASFGFPGGYTVYALALQPDGNILVGGDFSTYNASTDTGFGRRAKGLVRLTSTGNYDSSFNVNATSTYPGLTYGNITVYVQALAVQPDGKILVGGRFTAYNNNMNNNSGSSGSLVVSNIVRLLANGDPDASFSVGTTPGFNNQVLALALQPDGQVLVGGYFTSYTYDNTTTSVRGLIRLGTTGRPDAGFSPGAAPGFTGSGYVFALAVQADGQVLVGGNFSGYTHNGSTTTANHLIRLGTTGLPDASFSAGAAPGFNSAVGTLAVQPDGQVLVGGGFSSYTYAGTATTLGRIARLGTTGAYNSTATPLATTGISWSPGGSTAATLAVSSPGSYTATATAADGCVYVSAPVVVSVLPAITSFAPSSGAAGTPVTLTGTTLTGATSVSVNGVAVTPTAVTATSLSFVVPAGASAAQSITVTTPAGPSVVSTAFTVRLTVVVTGTSPAPNAVTAPVANSVLAVGFTEPVTAASAATIKVFSAQAGGLKAGTVTSSGSTATYTSSLGAALRNFRAGETVSVSVPATVLGTGGLALSAPAVYQFTTATLVSPGTFAARTDFGAGTAPLGVALGDVNGDGILDLVTANDGSSNASVLLGTGTGSFGTKTDFPTGLNPNLVVLGDLNGDGQLDIVTSNYTGSSASVLLNSGTGTFNTRTDYATGTNARAVALGDVNGDGALDIVTANYASANASVLLNSGTGSFGTRVDYPTGSSPTGIALGDVNNDGALDLVTANTASSNVSVLLNSGTGSFSAKTDYAAGNGAASVALADLNGDGKLDLAVANINGASASVLLGTGTGSFGPNTDYATGTRPQAVVLGDVNGDGILDLVTANTSSSNVSVLLNSGIGSFSAKTDYATGSSAAGVALADLNGDGRLDLAATNYSSATASVLLGLAPPVLTAVAPNPGGLGQPITLTGTNLGSPTALTINGANALAGILSNTGNVLVVRVPVTAAATGNVSISNAIGTATAPFTLLAPPGNALAFDGVDDYVSVPHNATAFNLTSAITLEAWVRTSVTGEQYITTKGDDSWYLAKNVSGGPAEAAAFYLSGPSDASGGWLYGTTNLADGRWHHVAGTYDGATLRLYVDGVQQNSRAVTRAINTGTHPVDIGARTGFAFWNGSLDEFRLYNTALTAAQVRADMTSTAAAVPASLVLYYNFDAGTPAGDNAGLTTLYDLSPNATPATLTGFALASGNTASNYVQSYAMVVPVATVSTARSTTGFTANWTAPVYGTATSYLLDVSTTADFASPIAGSPFATTATSYALTGLNPTSTYFYRVRALNSALAQPDQGAYSNAVGQATPLPVELAAFTATASGPSAVRLAWATASEKNSRAFEVERSVDGQSFERIGTVAAAGNSTAARSYALLDAQLPARAARLYYRLRLVDADGTFSYSPVRTVTLTGTFELALYPNPTHGAATLTGTTPGAAVTVFDALGRAVTTATADAAGTAALALPAALPTGVYVVRAGTRALRLTVE